MTHLKNSRQNIWTLIVVLFITVNCAHEKVEYEGKNVFTASSEKNNQGVVAQPTWLKHKEKTIDIYTKLTNTYDFPIQLKPGSVTLVFAGEKTVPRANHKLLTDIPGGVFQMALLIFDMPLHKQGGKAVLTIDDIYKADGKTKLPPLKVEFTVPALTN